MMIDITRATEVDQDVTDAVHDMFQEPQWDDDQTGSGDIVRCALMAAVRDIIAEVPPCPEREAAIGKLHDAWMAAKSAITNRATAHA